MKMWPSAGMNCWVAQHDTPPVVGCDSAHYRNSHFGKWPATWAKFSWLLMPLSANPIWAKSLYAPLFEWRARVTLIEPSVRRRAAAALIALAARADVSVRRRRGRFLRAFPITGIECCGDAIKIKACTSASHLRRASVTRLVRCCALISWVHRGT